MKWWKRAALLLFTALLCASLLPSARADLWNKKTVVTFNQPVQVPGAVLQPGIYVFKLMDSPSNRNIVQVLDRDERHLYATILAIPNYRGQPADKTVMTLEERPIGSPEAIKEWFYPGDNYGQEFVYRGSRGMELAQATTNQSEPTTSTDWGSNITSPAQSSSEPQMSPAPGQGVGPKEEEPAALQDQDQNQNQSQTQQQPAESSAQEKTPATLPRTASSLPLVALIGLVFLAAGTFLRVLARQRA